MSKRLFQYRKTVVSKKMLLLNHPERELYLITLTVVTVGVLIFYENKPYDAKLA